ncbi:SRPBCC domain-containing protein [Tenacibaculum sp. M341]|uniref:SRPBCC domain-containing protein n=1 Tax=Tenacibaculum sp. M341 TaxID=2530339 RepID=UPI00104F6FED|nr:SRPBCC domain-containing protein [Tenacibaculum sp. M341]TCI92796.1 SRPBCC domain-containing protein [Tenacibaculum sp. M341]
MQKQITTSITINATTEQIWAVLMDFENFPKWNSFIKSISGTPKVANTLHVQLQNMNFTPTVLKHRKNSEFIWKGKLFMKGIFDGEHRFYVKDNGNGSSTFEHSEKFSGILVPFFSKNLDKNVTKGFETMNKELKDFVEKINS